MATIELSSNLLALIIQHHQKKYPIVVENEEEFNRFKAGLKMLDPEFEVVSHVTDGKVIVNPKVKSDEWVELSEPEKKESEEEPLQKLEKPEPQPTAEMSLEQLVDLLNQRLVVLNKGDDIYIPPTGQSLTITDRKQALIGACGTLKTKYSTDSRLFEWSHLFHPSTIEYLEFLPTTIPNHSKEQTLALYRKLLPTELLIKLGLESVEFEFSFKAGDHVYRVSAGLLTKMVVKEVKGNDVYLFREVVKISKKPLSEMQILPITLPGKTSQETYQIYQDMFPCKTLSIALNKFELGDVLVVKDTVGAKCGAEIYAIDASRIGIHYLQWGERYDEWISIDSDRIFPEYCFNTKHIILYPDVKMVDEFKNIGLLLTYENIACLAKKGVVMTLCDRLIDFKGTYLFRVNWGGVWCIIHSCQPFRDDIRELVRYLV